MCGGSSGEGWTWRKKRQRILEQGSAVQEAVEDFTCRVGSIGLGSKAGGVGSRHHVHSASCFLLVLPVLPPTRGSSNTCIRFLLLLLLQHLAARSCCVCCFLLR